MRIFLDANVLFSAAKSDGAVRDLLRRLRRGGHKLCADTYVVAEARRNLILKSLEALDVLEQLLDDIEVASFQRGNAASELAHLLPEKDQPVLDAAVRLGCAALVTGDRSHFGALYGQSIAGVVIYSPRMLAELLLD